MKLIIPGIPIAQIRMKYSGRNGIGRIYDPREKEKKHVKAIITSLYSNRTYFNHPRVSFVFHMPIPKSIPKKLYALYASGLLKHEKKPDYDNLCKLYLDCLTGICFEDDNKVSAGPAVKLYHEYPKTIIIINEAQEILTPLEVDPMTWYALFSKECGKCSSSEMASLPDFYTPDYLESMQYSDNSYPHQIIPTLEPMPSVQHLLAQARQVSL